MISVEKAIYKIDQKLNKLSSNQHQQIEIEDKILALNEAQVELILSKVDENNLYKLGFDSFRKRYEDLQFLVEPHKNLKLTLSDNLLNKYSADLTQLPTKYLMYVGVYLTADKGDCKDRVLNINIIAKHSDITVLLNNTDFAPSFEYQETLGTISANNLEIYTDGSFTPKDVYVSYLRYPKEMDYEGYIKFDGTESKIQDSEFPEYLENELIEIVVRNLAMYTEDQIAAQYSQVRKQNNE